MPPWPKEAWDVSVLLRSTWGCLRQLLGILGQVALLALLLLLAAFGLLAPWLRRKARPIVQALKGRARAEWALSRRTPLRSAVAGAVLLLFGLNGVVRASGGQASWLSPRHLGDKARACLHLGLHKLGHRRDDHQDIDRALRKAAITHGVPLAWMRAVARTESNFRPHVISHAGAMGLMQLMPSTAAAMGVEDPFSALDNAMGGAKYLAQLSKRYGGELERVAAAYHAGPGAVPLKGSIRAGPITRRYARVVVQRAQSFAANPKLQTR